MQRLMDLGPVVLNGVHLTSLRSVFKLYDNTAPTPRKKNKPTHKRSAHPILQLQIWAWTVALPLTVQ